MQETTNVHRTQKLVLLTHYVYLLADHVRHTGICIQSNVYGQQKTLLSIQCWDQRAIGVL